MVFPGAKRGLSRGTIDTPDLLDSLGAAALMGRLGLNAEEMSPINLRPRLVYLSLLEFSAKDEDRAGIQAWEGIVAESWSTDYLPD
jgi:hypothetical protein